MPVCNGTYFVLQRIGKFGEVVLEEAALLLGHCDRVIQTLGIPAHRGSRVDAHFELAIFAFHHEALLEQQRKRRLERRYIGGERHCAVGAANDDGSDGLRRSGADVFVELVNFGLGIGSRPLHDARSQSRYR